MRRTGVFPSLVACQAVTIGDTDFAIDYYDFGDHRKAYVYVQHKTVECRALLGRQEVNLKPGEDPPDGLSRRALAELLGRLHEAALEE